MPSLNFKKPFAPMIMSGRKPHTIRGLRKTPIKIGDPLYLFTGLRTQYVERIGLAKAVTIYKIDIQPDEQRVTFVGVTTMPTVTPPYAFSGILPRAAIDRLAWADGFDSTYSFFKFFRGGCLEQGNRDLFEANLIFWGGTFIPEPAGGGG